MSAGLAVTLRVPAARRRFRSLFVPRDLVPEADGDGV